MKNNYQFFQNRDCEYFPCHGKIVPDKFNCMFCYCPLYLLGDECGGDFSYTESGIKDCSNCLVCHGPKAWDYMMEKLNKHVFNK